MSAEDLRARIREIPDFPKPGILFYDITTLLKDAASYRESIDLMTEPYRDLEVDAVVGTGELESILEAAGIAMPAQATPARPPVRRSRSPMPPAPTMPTTGVG